MAPQSRTMADLSNRSLRHISPQRRVSQCSSLSRSLSPVRSMDCGQVARRHFLLEDNDPLDPVTLSGRLPCGQLVAGPRTEHKFVPAWVYFARNDHMGVYKRAVNYYFARNRWPGFRELEEWFQRLCCNAGYLPEQYKRTTGFAPAWMFVLKVMADQEPSFKKWFWGCVECFFRKGYFPSWSKLPEELEQKCAEMFFDEDDYLVEGSS